MEVFGVPVNGPNMAIGGAVLLALWEYVGKKVPWLAMLGKLFPKLFAKRVPATADTSPVVWHSEPNPGFDFMYAMRDLHQLAHSPEEHARLGQFTADWWSAEQKESPVTTEPAK